MSANIELHNIDCMQYLATLEDDAFELAIVDPPFAIGASGGYFGNKKNSKNGKSKKKVVPRKHYANAKQTPDFDYFTQLFRVSKNQIIFGSNYYPQFLYKSGAIVWDKKNDNNTVLSDAEIAFQSFDKKINIFRFAWMGLIRGNKSFEYEGNECIHPNQKPVPLYEWILMKYAKKGDRILDTHLGSGSTAIACHNLGFDLVGCELDTDYFEKAKKRIEQHRAQLRIFC